MREEISCLSIQHAILCAFVILHKGVEGQVSPVTEGWSVARYQCIGAPYQRSKLHYCNTLRVSNGTTYHNVSLHVPNRLNFLNIVVKFNYKYTTYKPFMIDWNVEACHAMRTRRYNLMARVIAKIFEETVPSLYYPCPHGNTTYTVLWALDVKYFPKSLPTGDYRIDVSYKDRDNVLLFAMQVYGTMRRQGLIG